MAEEGFLRACLPVVGAVKLLFLQVSLLAALKWLKVSQGLSCLVVSHQDLLQRY
jgi:hypothetical protein